MFGYRHTKMWRHHKLLFQYMTTNKLKKITFIRPYIVTNFFIIKPLISQIYSGMKLYIFRTVHLSIIRNLFTVHSAMVYVIQVWRQLSSRTRIHPGKARKLSVWHIPLLSVQWINFWWWTDELSETCRVSCQNKFVKLVHLFGFIINLKNVVHPVIPRDHTVF